MLSIHFIYRVIFKTKIGLYGISASVKLLSSAKGVDVSGKMLDDIYNAHTQEAIDAKVYSILQNMKKEIEHFIKYKENDEIKQSMIEIISYRLDEVKELLPDLQICKLSPEEIICNFDIIKNAL